MSDQKVVNYSSPQGETEADGGGGEEEEEEHELETKALLFGFCKEKVSGDKDFETHQDARRNIEELEQALDVKGESTTALEVAKELVKAGIFVKVYTTF